MALKLFDSGVFAVAGMLFLASCTNTAHIEKSTGTDLSKYKTYSWVEDGQQKENKINRRNEIAWQNVQAAVDEQLQKTLGNW